jgi:putative phosphoribosyl transferase
MLFQDRFQAGRFLSSKLRRLANRSDVVILALPRGGVPVAYEVATALHAPLDVFVLRKLGVPGQPELPMGAIASGGIRGLNEALIRRLEIPDYMIDQIVAPEKEELERQERDYRGDRSPINVKGRTVVLVDDGLATGSSMRVAALALRSRKPSEIIVALPVAAPATCAEFESEVDQVVCAITPEPFWAVGRWYRDFSQFSDEEIREMLRRAASPPAQRAA